MAQPIRGQDHAIDDVLPLDPHHLRLRAELERRPHLGDVYTLRVYLDDRDEPAGEFKLIHHRHGSWHLGEQRTGEPAPSDVHRALVERLTNHWPEELSR